MKLDALDDMPRQLTAQAEKDKWLWLVAMSSMKGKERLDNIRLFICRYGEAPQIPVVCNPV